MIIFLYGPDTFRAQQKISDVRQKFIKDVDSTGSSIAWVDGAKMNIAELGQAFRPLSLFVKRRLVILQNPLSNPKKETLEELDTFLEQEIKNENILIIQESNFVEKKLGGKILIMKPGTDDKLSPLNKIEKKLFDRLQKSEFSQYFGQLSGVELGHYLISLAHHNSAKLSGPAAQLLIRLVGNDLWLLSQEINKLSAYALAQVKDKEANISEADIRLLTNQSIHESIFALTDALGNKQEKIALQLLDEQLTSGVHAGYILTMILWQFKTLISVRQALDSGLSSKDLGKLLGLHPYVLEKSINQVRKFNSLTLQTMVNRLINLDYRAKIGEGKIEELLPVVLVSV